MFVLVEALTHHHPNAPYEALLMWAHWIRKLHPMHYVA